MINLSKNDFDFKKTEYQYVDNSIYDRKIQEIDSMIKSKSKLFYFQLFTLFIWILCAVSNFVAHNMFSFYCNILCVVCWSFISYRTNNEITSLEKEKSNDFSKIIAKQKEQEKFQNELKSLDFFGRK